MTDLAAHIERTPLADSHEHLPTEDDYLKSAADILKDLFEGGYIVADLVVAGASPRAVKQLVDPTAGDVAARFAAVQDAWQRVQHTGYGEGLRRSAHIVYGLDELTPETLAAASQRTAELRRPGERLRLLQDVANIEYVQIDDGKWACPPDASAPDFFFRDITWLSFCDGRVDAPAIHEEVGVEIRNVATLSEAVAAIFAKHAPCAIAVKSQHAYDRTLCWRERTDADADRVLQKRLAGHELTEDERLCLGDWCWARGVELTIEHNLPFKHHTGYHAGHSGMILDQTRPAHLCPLLVKYPQARFVLMHGSYPYGGELRALAKHFPNVWIDLCWAWSIDPLDTADFVRRTIHAVPINKLFVFGGDSEWPTESVGYAAQCRHWLNRALQAEVDEGLLSERDAVEIATRVMRLNQAECFDLEGTRTALRAALP